jgi:F-type H+-transporting ATPase subunit a
MTTNQRGLMIFAGLLIFAVVVCGWVPFSLLPSMNVAAGIPVIQVPGETLIYDWLGPDFNLINTMVALVIADVVVLLIAFLAYRASKGWTKQVPGRFQAAIELIVGGLYGLCRNIGGPVGKTIFPLVASIFLFLLVANWMSIVPGVESVGLFHCAYPNTNGYQGTRVNDGLFQLRNQNPLNSGYGVTLEEHVACVEETGIGELHGKILKQAVKEGLVEMHDGHAVMSHPENPGDTALLDETITEGDTTVPKYRFHITPFVRPAATDLNLTLGLALISFTVIQIFGFRSQGLGYLQKFIPIRSLGNLSKKPMGAIDMIVGPLELVSEFSKIISLSFRLFGNIFAGAILLAVMLFLLGPGVPIIFYGLELIVGLAQALVFAVLTLVFVSQAIQSHHGDEHDEAH